MVNSTAIGYIYALFVNNNDIRYIGYSVEPMKRYSKHIRESKKLSYYRHKWIQSELNKNNKINIKILKVCKEKDLSKYEIEYIKKYKKLGYKLTNGNEGGLGGINPTKEVRERLKVSKLGNTWNIGRKHSKEFGEKISKRLKGVPKSKEHIEKFRLSRIGHISKNRKYSEDIIIKIFEKYNSLIEIRKIAKDLDINLASVNNILYSRSYNDIKIKYNLKLNRLI